MLIGASALGGGGNKLFVKTTFQEKTIKCLANRFFITEITFIPFPLSFQLKNPY